MDIAFYRDDYTARGLKHDPKRTKIIAYVTASLAVAPLLVGTAIGRLPERATAAERDEWTKGPTGFGARLLLSWLGGPAPLEGIAR